VILSKKGTCLDPSLYHIDTKVKKAINFKGSVNDLAPAIIEKEADATLLEIPDILIALQKWPGKIKIIGPISEPQVMGVAFRKDSKDLKKEFDRFFAKIKKDGTYERLLNKYYPSVFKFYKSFFQKEGIIH
jgi:ABC-type amino acid transport substrate-binding protein